MSGWVGDRCDRRGTRPSVARDGSRRPLRLLLGVALGLGGVVAPTVALAAPVPSGGPVPTRVTASSSAAPADASAPRYYLVGPPRDGQPEFLYQIAARTLGDGNRYREIFDLNRGRRQPDGGALTDPLTVLRPGWILVLPPDADGPAVRVGPLPSPDVAPPSGSGTTSADDSGGGATPYLMGAVGLVAVAGLLALALRRSRGAGDRSTPAATPPAPAATGTPADSHSDSDSGPVSGAPAPLGAATTATLTTGRPVSLLTRSGRVVVDLEWPTGRLDVRLLGTAPDAEAGTPCAWLDDDGPLPAATLPVVLGRRAGRRFFVDLAAAPDVVTVTGPVSSARQVALAVAEQLHAAGVAVTVVGDALGGDALGGDAPAAYRRVPAFPTDDAEAALTGPGVLISAGLRGAELAAARDLAARSGHRVVPVLVGEVVRSRWSVRVSEPKP
ncbi:hypothetical protein ACFOOK_00845 [Micromonospora krabiensis]|uniref:LysM domain-containing protein n=1 Tax=Micromonospora krabiensis TaxID=307121 RepID=A0A1C3MXN4_9ACTN|nr:hypothetical protein [Micromonospora krabiensis]SBV25071.1 hypothetical protein GA0070620_0540 [Micromonospora krabiensis]